jgi:hypothetical protein
MTRRTPRQAAAWHMVIGVLVILGTFVALSLVIGCDNAKPNYMMLHVETPNASWDVCEYNFGVWVMNGNGDKLAVASPFTVTQTRTLCDRQVRP